MSNEQKLREALQAISHIDDATNHSVDASDALDRIGQIARQGVIDLKSGEHYAGIALDAEGEHRHHLILLPGDVDMTWGKAREWASSIGGELPTRQEQSILFANLKGKFEQAYYWSNEQLASYTGYAWSQGFHDGYQINTSKGSELRARAVRRVPIHRKAA